MNALAVCFFVLLQTGGLLALYLGLAFLLAIGLAPFIPGYWIDQALGDTQALLLILLLRDRFFGEYSNLLRGVAKALANAKGRKANA